MAEQGLHWSQAVDLKKHPSGINRSYPSFARIIQKLGFPAKFKDFKFQNIVGSCDVKFPIKLEGLAFSHGAFSSVSAGGASIFTLISDQG